MSFYDETGSSASSGHRHCKWNTIGIGVRSRGDKLGRGRGQGGVGDKRLVLYRQTKTRVTNLLSTEAYEGIYDRTSEGGLPSEGIR